MKRASCRAWTFLGDYPLTIGGLLVGIAFALVLWTRSVAVQEDVNRIESRVVIIERRDNADAKLRRKAHICDATRPRSPACRELRRIVLHLTPAQRQRLAGGGTVRVPARPAPTGRTEPSGRPSAPGGGTTPTPPAQPPSGAPSAPSAGAKATSPSATVQANPPRVTATTPEVSVETPVGDLKVPSVSVTTPALPPLP